MAQNTEKKEKKFNINFSGFIRSDMVFNTRQVVSARGEGVFVLLPKPVSLDAEKNDVNAAPNFNISSLSSRLRGKISGPDVFGSKTSGLVEMDFIGPNGSSTWALRLRHAMVKLDWKTTQLLVGQYWHPMWATECFPGTVSFSSGTPFNPLSRNPQFRLTKKFGGISVLGAIMSQGMFATSGGKETTQNSMIPEAHIQVQYKNDLISAGAGVNLQSLRPQLKTSKNYVDETLVHSMSYFGYVKVSTAPITAKVYAMYGQNNDNMVMMGGYATKDMPYSVDQLAKGFVEYTAYNTLSSWVDFETTGKALKFGLFAGYAQNMGTDYKHISGTEEGRWIGKLDVKDNPTSTIHTMYRIAPRVSYKINNMKFGFEVEYASVAYASQEVDENGAGVVGSDLGGIDAYGVVTNREDADNIKVLLSVAYIF